MSAPQELTLARARDLPKEERIALLRSFASDPRAAVKALFHWRLWARPNQLAPDPAVVGFVWFVWFILAGRGFGKTRSAAEWIREEVDAGKRRRIAFVSKDPADARDVMIEGQSGILAVYPEDHPNRPKYEPSKKRITWPNGAVATIYSGEDPEAVRGPEFDCFWADELAAWKYPKETWDNLVFATRLEGPKGDTAQGVVTTTPKPIQVVRDLVDDELTVVTGGSTYENLENLDRNFRHNVIRRYEGTRIGQQELEAAILDESEGALWSRDLLDETRCREKDLPELQRLVVAIDPQSKKNAKRKQGVPETGIVACGSSVIDGVEHFFVVEDASGIFSPNEWATKAIATYKNWSADRVIGEVNNGGDMVETTIHNLDRNIPFSEVWASRGKYTRAEPISGLFEQGRAHLVGTFGELETQLCTWTGDDNEPSPDRLDAMVWGLTHLMAHSTVAPDVQPVGIVLHGAEDWDGEGY